MEWTSPFPTPIHNLSDGPGRLHIVTDKEHHQVGTGPRPSHGDDLPEHGRGHIPLVEPAYSRSQ